jgi:hypothetical protein
MIRTLALVVGTATCNGCVLISAPLYPDKWAPITVGEENECPDLGGTFAASGEGSGAVTLFWFVPIWWSSNRPSIPRLDKDLALSTLPNGSSIEIEGTAALLLDQRGPEHVRIAVMRDDRHRVEGVGDVTYARSSSRLEDRARDFECRDGRIEFAYLVDHGSEAGTEFSTIRVGRTSDGALVVKASDYWIGPNYFTILVWWNTWHRYEALPDLQITPDLSEAPP